MIFISIYFPLLIFFNKVLQTISFPSLKIQLAVIFLSSSLNVKSNDFPSIFSFSFSSTLHV